MSFTLDQTMVSRDVDALPFKRKGRNPDRPEDNVIRQIGSSVHSSSSLCPVLSGINPGKQLPVLKQCHNRVKAI